MKKFSIVTDQYENAINKQENTPDKRIWRHSIFSSSWEFHASIWL